MELVVERGKKNPRGFSISIFAPSDPSDPLRPHRGLQGITVLFDNYVNAGMIVGQYVLRIKVESSNSVIFMIPKCARSPVRGTRNCRIKMVRRASERKKNKNKMSGMKTGGG